jgi:hypothetical protein
MDKAFLSPLKALKKNQQGMFAFANAVSLSMSPILINFLFIRYLDGKAIYEGIFIFTLIYTVGLPFFLSIELLVPRYLLDSRYSRSSILLLSLKINMIFATCVFFVSCIGLAYVKSSGINFFATFLYIYSLAFFVTCSSILRGSNQFSYAFLLTSFDFLFGLTLLVGLVATSKVYFWSILCGVAIARIFTSMLWFVWMYRRDRITEMASSVEELSWNKKLNQILIHLVLIGAGLQLLNNLPILLISHSSTSNNNLIEIVVLIQIVRGIYGLLSGFTTMSLNTLNEINLSISGQTQKQVLVSNVRVTVIAFLAVLSIFYLQGGNIVAIYTSQNASFNIVVLILVLFNESLLYIFGILRLTLVSVGRFLLVNFVIGSTILTLILMWMFFNRSSYGILYSVTISTSLGLASLYFIIFVRRVSLSK